ncbi:UDP-N-acetylglucosamine 2-epimerase (non-hydrolyzing) [Helicobacter cholecystus]|uniref:UDP-N-acetylglucosamine 2-epimerase (Non-hydrolyzing) n=1 Tax=Helicobacter cholecystus TaxID=45498 RepID=A0A3D8IXC0_9HELI|nr:UDP-N-acetylglucosamine 2-epimerase (non-hydrolyzing) [Helicobacter cholecystus]RDU69929.1 UDP-N-acetylglucosamine 2-epimerase (non-hydrolyzing) [Helicobacter cholecystus]VEJ24908.1 UDP-N-acetylglucosamine 2-epimerase [Helicobacter cholecystus]
MRILSILGARPQFIKHASLQKHFVEFGIDEVLLHTGQHFDDNMSKVFFSSLSLKPPTLQLEIQSTNSLIQLGEMLGEMQKRVGGERFDWVIVYGDTTSTLAGSLFAKENSLALAHIEAGVRSFDMNMPEERNRVLCDQLSDKLFAPNESACENLLKEGVRGDVILSGDVMEEGFELFSPLAQKPEGLSEESFILCTLHRQSNVDHQDRLHFLLEGLGKIPTKILLPLHPRTKKRLEEFSLSLPRNIIALPPQGYLQTLWLLKNAQMVMTDSGGLQKEAVYAKKPCLILREVSEWGEFVECGASYLLGNMELNEAYSKTLLNFLPLDLNLKEKPTLKIVKELLKEKKG